MFLTTSPRGQPIWFTIVSPDFLRLERCLISYQTWNVYKSFMTLVRFWGSLARESQAFCSWFSSFLCFSNFGILPYCNFVAGFFFHLSSLKKQITIRSFQKKSWHHHEFLVGKIHNESRKICSISNSNFAMIYFVFCFSNEKKVRRVVPEMTFFP